MRVVFPPLLEVERLRDDCFRAAGVAGIASRASRQCAYQMLGCGMCLLCLETGCGPVLPRDRTGSPRSRKPRSKSSLERGSGAGAKACGHSSRCRVSTPAGTSVRWQAPGTRPRPARPLATTRRYTRETGFSRHHSSSIRHVSTMDSIGRAGGWRSVQRWVRRLRLCRP